MCAGFKYNNQFFVQFKQNYSTACFINIKKRTTEYFIYYKNKKKKKKLSLTTFHCNISLASKKVRTLPEMFLKQFW